MFQKRYSTAKLWQTCMMQPGTPYLSAPPVPT